MVRGFYLIYMPGMHTGTHQRIGRCLIALGSWWRIGDSAQKSNNGNYRSIMIIMTRMITVVGIEK